MKSGAQIDSKTSQDDIPPVHVLEAAQNQDRKETEDLLAGFDRPGRSPKPAPRERDFVDYYAKKKSGGPDSGSGRVSSSAPPAPAVAGPTRPKQGEISTVVVPRKGDGMPAWVVWVGAGVLMALVGGGVAYLATNDTHSTAVVPTGPSAATTITAATPVPASALDNTIPPPAPVEATVTVEPTATATAPGPKGGRRDRERDRDPKTLPSAIGSSVPRPSGGVAGDTKPPPRDDFIRDL